MYIFAWKTDCGTRKKKKWNWPNFRPFQRTSAGKNTSPGPVTENERKQSGKICPIMMTGTAKWEEKKLFPPFRFRGFSHGPHRFLYRNLPFIVVKQRERTYIHKRASDGAEAEAWRRLTRIKWCYVLWKSFPFDVFKNANDDADATHGAQHSPKPVKFGYRHRRHLKDCI